MDTPPAFNPVVSLCTCSEIRIRNYFGARPGDSFCTPPCKKPLFRGDGTAALLALTLSGLRAPGVRVEGAATEEEEEARLYEIVISENKPLGHGVIWLKAGAETTNGRPCDVFYIP